MRRLLVLALLLATPAASAQPVGTSLTSAFDMQPPAASVASCDDPLALLYNPAALHWAPDLEGLFLHQERLALDLQPRGRASGLFLSLGEGGFGVQYLMPDLEDSERNYLKFTLAGTLVRAGQWFALGYSLDLLDPTETHADPSVDFSVGAMIRPFRFLSLGAVGRNLGNTELLGARAPRSLDLGLAVRPLWFDLERFTLACDVRLLEEAEDPPVRLTAQLAVVDGINLFGTGDLDGNFGVGLMVDFQRFGIGGYTGFARTNGVHAATVTTIARVSRDARPGFGLSRQQTVEILLDHTVVPDGPPAFSWFSRRVSSADIEAGIRRALEDPEVDSILLKVEEPDLPFSQLQELRAALADFRSAGKRVVVHLQDADNLRYYLASVGDTIVLAPAGVFALLGPKVEATFLKGTLDIVGVKAEYQRVGRYKTAVESVTESAPSEGYREVIASLADEIADQMLGAIARDRGFAPEKLQQILALGLIRPSEAKSLGLVTEVGHFDEVDGILEKALGHNPSRVSGYLDRLRTSGRWTAPPTVAVVHASGTIAYGSGVGGGMDAKALAGLLSALRDDGEVRAVVLRVDSPGGSGAASDLIWREVVRLKERKPVIVSMSTLAASGGYYISCPATAIVADPATLTGSIGVFALLLDASELYAKLGITHTVERRGPHADFDSTFRSRTPEEMEILRKSVTGFYQEFIQKVAQGRNLTPEQVDALGQGRVWTGRQAKERGLVDELGGLSKAILLAKHHLGMEPGEEIRLVHLPRAGFNLSVLMQEIGILAQDPLPLPPVFRDSLIRLAQLAALSNEPALAILPLWITIR